MLTLKARPRCAPRPRGEGEPGLLISRAGSCLVGKFAAWGWTPRCVVILVSSQLCSDSGEDPQCLPDWRTLSACPSTNYATATASGLFGIGMVAWCMAERPGLPACSLPRRIIAMQRRTELSAVGLTLHDVVQLLVFARVCHSFMKV